MKDINQKLFEKAGVQKAFWTLVLPTIISQLIGVVYNMTDSFWIGQMNIPAQIAAATICVPTILFILGIANLFGIGGASLIARCLGKKELNKAKSACAFSLWSAIGIAVFYGITFAFFEQPILFAIGATPETYIYCQQYVLWTVIIGSIPGTLSTVFAHLVRSEGYAKQASFGMILGLVLNIILDPIFIFFLKMEITGAALATFLSMSAGCVYFVWFIHHLPKASVLTTNPRYYRAGDKIASEVLLVGLPSALMSWMAMASGVVLNVLTASYSTVVVAGMGIAKRLDMVIFAISNGIGQGVLPLISYNYAAKNYARMKAAIKITLFYSVCFAFLITGYLFFGAHWTTQLFIEDAETVAYGKQFLQIICLTCPCVAITLVMMTIFQAVGKKAQPTILSLVRKGGLDIPLMYGLNALMGVTGIAWAIPVEDVLAMLIAIGLFIPFWHSIQKEECLETKTEQQKG